MTQNKEIINRPNNGKTLLNIGDCFQNTPNNGWKEKKIAIMVYAYDVQIMARIPNTPNNNKK